MKYFKHRSIGKKKKDAEEENRKHENDEKQEIRRHSLNSFKKSKSNYNN